MTRALAAMLIALAILCTVGGCPRGAKSAAVPTVETPTDVVAAGKGAIEQWRQAYEIRSMDGLSKLYAKDLDVVHIQEGVATLGWSSVQALLKDRLARQTSIRIRLKDIRVVSLGTDVASAVATMTRELSDGTTTVTENGTLSLVLRKTGADWVIVVEHYSYNRS